MPHCIKAGQMAVQPERTEISGTPIHGVVIT